MRLRFLAVLAAAGLLWTAGPTVAQQNNAAVDKPANQKLADEVAAKLISSGVVPKGYKVDIKCVDGVVHLTGSVATQEQHLEILRTLTKVQGIKRIECAIIVGDQPLVQRGGGQSEAGLAPPAPPPMAVRVGSVNSPKPSDMARPSKMTLPSPHYLEGHPPQYFPEESKLLKPAGRQVLKTYAVGDLVVPPPVIYRCCTPAVEITKTREMDLIRKIITTVEPATWSTLGGEGSIEYYPLGLALVVNQTRDVHEKVEQFLEQLRKFQDFQIVVDLRIVTVSDAWIDKCDLPKQFFPCRRDLSRRATRTEIMTAEAIEKLVRSATEDPGTSVMTLPKLTSLNWQPAQVRVGQTERFVTDVSVKSVNGNLICIPKTDEHEMGVAVTVEPTISADGKSVQLNVSGTVREHALLPVPMTPLTTMVPPVPEKGKRGQTVPFTQFLQEPKIITRTVRDIVDIPDGGSALFYGGKETIEETIKERLPTLADVPVVADLFAKDKKTTSTNHLLVVVTTHVIKPDADVKQCGSCCSADSKLGKLIAEYKQACHHGKVEEARRLAIECLVIDPTCFGKK